MKKKNGFTLIELLAVIVILAIIALIAVPQILNILNNARLNAAKDSTYGIVKASETYATNFMLENNGSLPNEDIEFTCDGSNCNLKNSLTGYNITNLDKLDFKGTKPKSGTIRISDNGKTIIAENLQINGFNCNYINDIATCTSGGSSETPEPTIPVKTGPTSENPPSINSDTGVNNYTGVIKIVYLDPTDLTKTCDSSNSVSTTETKIGCMKWYAYNDDGTNYTMILDHNTTAKVAWNSSGSNSSMGEVATQLTSDTAGWNSSLSPRLITANEIAQITGNTSWTISSTDAFYLDSKSSILPATGQGTSKYAWLFDYTDSCTSYGCNATDSSTYGYWTSSPYASNSSYAWHMTFDGGFSNRPVTSTFYGARPVITVERSKIN